MSRPPRLARAAATVPVASVTVTLVLALAAGCSRAPEVTLSHLPAPGGTGSTDAPSFGPGADGIGDAYYPKAGNGGYDVGNYDVDIAYDPGSKQLTGVATITATATADLSRFNLDFVGLHTDSITVDGAGADAATDPGTGSELIVTPARPIPTGTAFTTVVRYSGRPTGYHDPQLGDEGFLTTADGAFAIGEPEVAATWFPVNDHPRDKATYTVRISAPSGLAALSNGVLESKVDTPSRSGFSTWTWHESSPMAPYLATVVIGTYRVHESVHNGLPVVTAVHTSLSMNIDAELARTPEVVDFLATQFGPYPFDAMGGIAISDQRIQYALENQTRPVYAAGFFAGGDSSWVLAHELAHQWYGDSVSVHDWSEIWLNEGFATYAEWLWEEHEGGLSVQQSFDRLYEAVPAGVWSVPPAAPGKDDLFSDSVYTRGGLTLQALRVTVGDEAFFQILRQWASSKKDSSATTGEFVALAEQVSGRQLDQLFQDWLYGSTRPARP